MTAKRLSGYSQKGRFSQSFHHFEGVILYVNILPFYPRSTFFVGTGDIGSGMLRTLALIRSRKVELMFELGPK
jgi:hypothetical protein